MFSTLITSLRRYVANALNLLPLSAQQRTWPGLLPLEPVANEPRLGENSKARSATRMMFSSSIEKLNGLAVWALKSALNR
jgi:hypothetical protein